MRVSGHTYTHRHRHAHVPQVRGALKRLVRPVHRAVKRPRPHPGDGRLAVGGEAGGDVAARAWHRAGHREHAEDGYNRRNMGGGGAANEQRAANVV